MPDTVVERAETCPDGLFKIHPRDLPEFLLQTTGNLIVWSGHNRLAKTFTWVALSPVFAMFWLLGVGLRIPTCTIRRYSSGDHLKRMRLFVWPAIFVGLLAYQYVNWLPYVGAVLLFSLGILLIWFVVSATAFVVPTNAFSIKGTTALTLFTAGSFLFVLLYPTTLHWISRARVAVFESPWLTRHFGAVSLSTLVGVFSFVYFRTAVGAERTMATGKDLRNLVVIKDPLIANAVTVIFAFKSFRDVDLRTSHAMVGLAGLGILLLFAARLICHFAQAAEESRGLPAVRILDSAGNPHVTSGLGAIHLRDQIAYVAYLVSWLLVIWSIALYLYSSERSP